MRSEDNLYIFRDDPKRLVELWREAAETSRQQFPGDERRYNYYLAKAEELEKAA